MTVIETIQLIFVFAGSLIMVIAIVILMKKLYRKQQLYRLAEALIDIRRGETKNHWRYERNSFLKLKEELSPKDITPFLSKLQVSDIIDDAFLKEVLNELIKDHFIPESINWSENI